MDHAESLRGIWSRCSSMLAFIGIVVWAWSKRRATRSRQPRACRSKRISSRPRQHRRQHAHEHWIQSLHRHPHDCSTSSALCGCCWPMRKRRSASRSRRRTPPARLGRRPQRTTTIRCRAGGCGCSSSRWSSASATSCSIRASAATPGALGWTQQASTRRRWRQRRSAGAAAAGAASPTSRCRELRKDPRPWRRGPQPVRQQLRRLPRLGCARRAGLPQPDRQRLAVGQATGRHVEATIADGRIGVMPAWQRRAGRARASTKSSPTC